MSYSSELTRKRILESAKQEFLSNSFLNANLKTIAENAKVTTGALYRHFAGKDELFFALFKEEYEFLANMISNSAPSSAERIKNLISDEEIETSVAAVGYFIDYIYQHLDAFRLMFLCAEGSQYSDVREKLIDLYATRNISFYEEMYQQRVIRHKPAAFEIKFISKVFFSSIIECIYQDISYEEAKAHIRSFIKYHQYGCFGMMGTDDK